MAKGKNVSIWISPLNPHRTDSDITAGTIHMRKHLVLFGIDERPHSINPVWYLLIIKRITPTEYRTLSPLWDSYCQKRTGKRQGTVNVMLWYEFINQYIPDDKYRFFI